MKKRTKRKALETVTKNEIRKALESTGNGGISTVLKLEPGGGRMHLAIGTTTNKEIRSQICEVIPWQTAKTAMGSYDNKRQEAWDRLGRPPY